MDSFRGYEHAIELEPIVSVAKHAAAILSTEAGRTRAQAGKPKPKPKQEHPLLAARERYAMRFLMSKGLTRAAAAGVVGNLIVESGNYLNPAEPGGGIAQWGGARFTKLRKFEGGKPNFKKQIQFVLLELKESPRNFPRGNGLDALRAAKTPEQAALAFMNNFERPRAGETHQDRRITDAKRVYRGDYGSPA